ncbi:MAG: helix-turn-helix transcriptional regulator [Burkholderiales bacterium]|jgi:hypothetical protein
MPSPTIPKTEKDFSSTSRATETQDGDLNAARLLSLTDILGNAKLGTSGLIPISQSGWFLGIRKGIYPKPVKIGRRSLWKASDIRALLAAIGQGELQ